MTLQNPMPIDRLPEYLKSVKETGNVGPSNLVDVGQIIIEETPPMQWVKRIGFALILFMTLGIGSVATYKVVSTERFTVVADLDPTAISQLVSDSGGQIVSVKYKEGSTYEVKAATRQGRIAFLEWLRKNKGVRKASLKNEGS